MKPKFYMTCAIPYANGEPHIGHAYEVVAADMIARFKRLDGFDVRFQTGMDEHGLKIQQTAAKLGTTPQALVDEVAAKFRKMYDAFGITYTDMIRTTEERHKKSVQVLWQKLVEKGDIYLGKYAGFYSVRDEAYFDESELTDGADGKKLAPTGAPVEWMEEESYFFKLSAYQDKLLDFYTRNPRCIAPKSRFNEIFQFVKSGLRDLSISRTTFNWGVPVPGDPKHVMYVWVDALSNYITALGYPNEDEDSLMKKYWPADLHMIGKDIIRFHTVYWPAFLMSAGIELPKRVFAHGWWTNEGEKMSKSVGNVVDPNELIATYGLDQTRYYMVREAPFGLDSDFSHDSLIKRINSNLANDLGNLAQRSLSMIAKNCASVVPTPGERTESDKALLGKAQALLPLMRAAMDEQALHKALDAAWDVIGDANRYVDEQAPWALKKTDPVRMAAVLYVLAETVRYVAILLQPYMPGSMAKMLDQLAVPENERDFTFLNDEAALKAGTPLPAPAGVFPRFALPEDKKA